MTYEGQTRAFRAVSYEMCAPNRRMFYSFRPSRGNKLLHLDVHFLVLVIDIAPQVVMGGFWRRRNLDFPSLFMTGHLRSLQSGEEDLVPDLRQQSLDLGNKASP